MRLAHEVSERGRQDDIRTHSDALAFKGFLSTLPIVLLAFSGVGFFLADNEQAQQEWVERIAGAVPGLEPLISDNLQAVVSGRYAVGLIGLVAVAWAASSLIAEAIWALGKIFRSGEPTYVGLRAGALWKLLVVGVAALVAIAVPGLIVASHAGPATAVIIYAVGLAVDLGFILLVYRLLTPSSPPVRAHVPGGIVMVVVWDILKAIGSLLVAYTVSRKTAVYGTVGAIFGFLVIIRIAATSFLWGAELNAVLLERRSAN